MKKKIIGIFVLTLIIISTGLPVSGFLKVNQLSEKSIISNHFNDGWYKTYGYEGTDAFNGLDITNEGNYIVSGWTKVYDTNDAWILKIDPSGEIIWEIIYNHPDGWDGLGCIKQTSDYGYIATGFLYNGSQENIDALLIKTDSSGNISWVYIYEGLGYDLFIGVVETINGYVVSGCTSSNSKSNQDLLILKTDFNGNLIWSKTLYQMEFQEGDFIIDASDGFLVTASKWSTSDFYPPDGLLIKFDYNGNEIWNKSYGNKLYSDVLTDIDNTNDGNFILSGGTKGGLLGFYGSDIWLMKVDVNGNRLWEKSFGLPFLTDHSPSVEETKDLGFILTGHMLGFGNILVNGAAFYSYWSKIFLIKTDSMGNRIWTKLMPGHGHGRTVKETNDGYIICGYEGSGHGENSEYAILIKTDENGNIN
jgi:hypothetical protein